jgi:hypothetical protein
MDLMLEQMRQQVVAALDKDTRLSAIRLDPDSQLCLGEFITELNERLVAIGLRRCQIERFLKGHERVKRVGPPATIIQRIQIVVIDRQNVVERRLDRREKADARGIELILRQVQAGLIKPIVCPRVVARHLAQMQYQRHRSPQRLAPGINPAKRPTCHGRGHPSTPRASRCRELHRKHGIR